MAIPKNKRRVIVVKKKEYHYCITHHKSTNKKSIYIENPETGKGLRKSKPADETPYTPAAIEKMINRNQEQFG